MLKEYNIAEGFGNLATNNKISWCWNNYMHPIQVMHTILLHSYLYTCIANYMAACIASKYKLQM